MVGPIRVLHVDDDAAFAELAAEHLTLTNPDLEIETVPDAATALDRLDVSRHDCIVSDHEMPETTGLELLEVVRERHPDLPFILFTGKGSEEVAADAVSAGVTDYLQKGSTETYELLANRIANAVSEREHSRRFQTLTETAPGIAYRVRNTPDWGSDTIHGEVETLTGYEPASFLDGSITWGSDIMHPDDTEAVYDAVQSAIAADDPFELTYRIITRAGETKWVWERGRRVETVEDGPDILEGFITDITERKRREQAIERERNRFEAVFDTVPEPVVHVVFEGDVPVVRRVNAAFTDIFGYDTDEARGRPIDELIVPSTDRESAADINEAVVDANYHQAEIVRQTPSGHRPFLFTVKTMETEVGLEGVATYVDLTEQTQREAELARQNERLDQFVSMVSHDLRNPLNVAQGRVELAAEAHPDDEHLDIAIEALGDMADLIEEVVGHARDED